MVRARLAHLALASSLLMASGCASMRDNECNTGGGWFSRFRLASRSTASTAAPCPCEGGMPMSSGEVMVPPNGFVSPDAFATPGVVAPPGAFVAPPPTIMTTPPTNGQPPRIVPVPATPMPWSGT